MDTKYDELISVIHSEIEANGMYKDVTPTMRKRKKRYKPYWNDELGQLWADARDSERQYLKSKRNAKDTRDLRCEFQHKRKIFDMALRRSQRQYTNEQRQRIDTLRTDNPREFWNEIDKLGPDRPHQNTSESVKLSDGTITDDPDIVLQRWKDDFQSLYNSPWDTENTEFVDAIEQLSNEWEREYQDILQRGEDATSMEIFPQAEQIRQAASSLNRTIPIQETVTALQCTRNGKAVGVDNIANEILKVPGLQVCLHDLYSACFEMNIVPTMWYQAIIHPILKRGKSPLFSLSYRGISLMSCVCKVFSSILNNRLVLYAETNDIFAEEQNGFRKLRSCVDHISVLTTILRNRKQQGLSTFSAFIDFSKAFDSVSHAALWHKLLAYGIHGNMLNTIKCLHSNLQSCVRMNGRLTDWFSQSAGVRQGDNLAPTLFALFINDLAAEINNLGRGVDTDNRRVSNLLYADDTVFIAETEEHLQEMLDTLHGWTCDSMLSVNLEKTKIIHFRKSSTARTEFLFTLDTHPVDLETQYRYLGLDLSETLDFTHGVSILTKSASKALGKVTSKYFSINGLSHTVYKRMYDSLVVPVMDYAAAVWGTKRYDACAVVQNRAMRTFLGVGKCSPLPGICGDLRWTSAFSRQQATAVRYFMQLTRMPRSRLTRQIFEWDYDRALNGRRSWCRDIKEILHKCGMVDRFERQHWHRDSVSETYRSVVTCLDRLQRQQQSRDGQMMSRLRIYNALSMSSGEMNPVEMPYLRLDRGSRTSIAKLRTGTLPLSIETGRYRQIAIDQRLCRSCDRNVIENEIHFIFHCEKYNDIRTDLSISYRNSNPVETLDEMMSDYNMCRKLSKYLLEALRVRTH